MCKEIRSASLELIERAICLPSPQCNIRTKNKQRRADLRHQRTCRMRPNMMMRSRMRMKRFTKRLVRFFELARKNKSRRGIHMEKNTLNESRFSRSLLQKMRVRTNDRSVRMVDHTVASGFADGGGGGPEEAEEEPEAERAVPETNNQKVAVKKREG